MQPPVVRKWAVPAWSDVDLSAINAFFFSEIV